MSDGGAGRRLVVFDQVDLSVLLIPVGPLYMGWVLASRTLLPDSWQFLVALLAMVPFLGLGTVLLNDAYDTSVDSRSARKGRFASSNGTIAVGRLRTLAAVSFLASVLLGLLASLEFAIVIVALVVLAVLYSVSPVQLSRRPGLDLAANMVGIGVGCTIAGWVLVEPGSLPPTVWLVTSALGTGTFFMLTALMDYESDREGGKRTVVVALGWTGSCWLGLSLIGLADVGIVYMSLASVILRPSFLWVAGPIIGSQLSVFPVMARRRDLLRAGTTAIGGLLFLGNLLILLSYLDLLGPF